MCSIYPRNHRNVARTVTCDATTTLQAQLQHSSFANGTGEFSHLVGLEVPAQRRRFDGWAMHNRLEDHGHVRTKTAAIVSTTFSSQQITSSLSCKYEARIRKPLQLCEVAKLIPRAAVLARPAFATLR